ncbi:hypothetical protein OVA24_07430 [Luteolibacter sp. SL250]|uniref:hypothetical protein n=1 Tax=Luteolibacter sp. SL250 TaxID=2995170 RepID=UPI00226FB317|nr:hypothetical protein [Luteolibacter sp. SL250]WAC21213.1 hypothetical protein OVA24_07430 [Luteolibacter sp. SL250]
MSSQPAEPEKYSLDEMLERLQGKSSPTPEDSGELVTRADGTQAIKVRKRKRRSTQPHKDAAKKASRLRAFQVSSVVVLMILAGMIFGGLIIYANSAPYRKKIISKFNTGTGANILFQQLQISPTGMVARGADLEWPEGNLLKSLSLTEIRAQSLMGGVIGNRWSVNEVSATGGKLVIGSQQGGQPLRYFPAAGSSPISVERLAVANLDILLGDTNAPSLRLLKTEGSFYPGNGEGPPSVRLFRGEMHVPEWPVFRMDRALLDIKQNGVEIVSMRLFHELDNLGNIELTGAFDPSATGKEQSLEVKMNSFNMNGIAGTSLGHLVAGRVDTREIPGGRNELSFSSSNPAGRLHVAFSSSSNSLPRLNNFSFLRKLSQLTDNPWFLDPLFHDGCTGILHRENGVVRISELAIVSKTQLKVTGDLSLEKNEVLSGTLEVGLPEATVTAGRNPALAQVFKESKDGFRWVTLKISGTSGRPVDNFAELAQAAGETVGEPDESKDLFETLTTPQGR